MAQKLVIPRIDKLVKKATSSSILMILKYVIEINIFNNFFLFFSTLVSEIFAKYCRYHYSVFLPIVVRLCSVYAS